MAYILRFTQHYKPENRREFLALEASFEQLERCTPGLPKGRRSQPIAGPDPTHSLIWECEFATFAGVEDAMAKLAGSPGHAELFNQQARYITQIHTSIFETLELPS